MTPVMVFSLAVAAPNGLEMCAALALWCSLLALVRLEPDDPRPAAHRCGSPERCRSRSPSPSRPALAGADRGRRSWSWPRCGSLGVVRRHPWRAGLTVALLTVATPGVGLVDAALDHGVGRARPRGDQRARARHAPSDPTLVLPGDRGIPAPDGPGSPARLRHGRAGHPGAHRRRVHGSHASDQARNDGRLRRRRDDPGGDHRGHGGLGRAHCGRAATGSRSISGWSCSRGPPWTGNHPGTGSGPLIDRRPGYCLALGQADVGPRRVRHRAVDEPLARLLGVGAVTRLGSSLLVAAAVHAMRRQ